MSPWDLCTSAVRRLRGRKVRQPDNEQEPDTKLAAEEPPEVPAPPLEDSQQQPRRVFPFQSSAMDPWRADKFLNDTLGEGKWSLEQRTDRLILSAERDLTPVSSSGFYFSGS